MINIEKKMVHRRKVPCSGGKDGSYVAHKLREQYNMNPLCNMGSLKATNIGGKNLESFTIVDFPIMGTPNPETTRKLTKLSFNYLEILFSHLYMGNQISLNVAVNYKP